jgi:hypothetical protein
MLIGQGSVRVVSRESPRQDPRHWLFGIGGSMFNVFFPPRPRIPIALLLKSLHAERYSRVTNPLIL